MRDDKWKEIDFSTFDVVVHVAVIAHQDTKANQEYLYYKVNTDLTIELATKAKAEGVKQFIFMSSMIVYGASSKIGETKVITRETIPEPINFYGKGSKGNYPLLAKFAKISPVFPDIDNQRSMLHIYNLNEFIRLMIENEEKGTFFPQNKEHVKTSLMVKKSMSFYTFDYCITSFKDSIRKTEDKL